VQLYLPRVQSAEALDLARRLHWSILLGVATTMVWATALRASSVPVFNTNDSLGGSLRQAIQDANIGDTIVFQIPTSDSGYNATTGVFSVSLSTAELAIAKTLTIDGGGQKIIVQRSSGTFRIFNITAGTVNLSNLTIANGVQDNGGGIGNESNLTLRNCTLYGNNTGDSEGGYGGAIYSTVGSLQVSNCTLTANKAAPGGSAIVTGSGDTVIDNSTIFSNTGNSAVFRRGSGTIRVRNSIIAGNVDGDVAGTFISEGYNLIGTTSAGDSGFGSTGDHVGATITQINLAPLTDNGGPTQTMQPQPGSLAIDQGNRGLDSFSNPINVDQRGNPRPVDQPGVNNATGGDGSDIGAVETGLPQPGSTFTVTTTSEHDDGVCSTDDCTLLEAINASNANADINTINFAPGLGGVILNTVVPSGLSISQALTITGPGARVLTISGNNAGRVFEITGTSEVVNISGLTIANGNSGIGVGGAGISNSATLNLRDCAVLNNFGGSGAGAGNGGTLRVTNCTFAGNQSTGHGGALRNVGDLVLTNSTFNNNTAVSSGAITSFVASGQPPATLNVTNCTISGNTASDTSGGTGGGIFNGNLSTATVTNTIIANNTAATGTDVSGPFTSGGHNLIRIATGSTGFTNGNNGDQVGIPAGLDTLKDNGGPTDTMALLSDSTARDTGGANAPPTDQRGFLRSGISDIGAFEFGGEPLRITSITRLANGHIVLQCIGVANQVNDLQVSPDLSPGSFMEISPLPVAADPTGAFTYNDAGAAGPTKRFYRLAFP
jgi:predicted outer membrane repeat protein